MLDLVRDGSKISGPQQTEVLQSGGSQSLASRTPFSRLPYFFVALSPDSRPLLCFSCYHVNHAVWLPILTGSALALSKIKNGVVNRTTSHSPARSLKRHSFDTTLHHAAKSSVFCELELYGASSQEGLPWKDFSPPHRRIRDRSKWSLTTFYLTRFVVLTENLDS